ncbi:hypothetical protein HanXRQr2_Chr15g0685381 [Helianthus annuus]|uniref:Uncharacterized protein n=1 Tax=Helianthus annuus TaxID=4232 RepID=A0A9K3DZ06_HELAN|nr:hypothetical protein HanXRQr2_Chr15g0685381 [Helianthus annuus]
MSLGDIPTRFPKPSIGFPQNLSLDFQPRGVTKSRVLDIPEHRVRVTQLHTSRELRERVFLPLVHIRDLDRPFQKRNRVRISPQTTIQRRDNVQTHDEFQIRLLRLAHFERFQRSLSQLESLFRVFTCRQQVPSLL